MSQVLQVTTQAAPQVPTQVPTQQDFKHLDYFYAEAKPFYDFNNLSYHNWNHVMEVLASASLIMSAEHPDTYNHSIHLAALYHDAIYFAGAKNSVNEAASAAALKSVWMKCKHHADNSITTLNEAMELIEYSSIDYHLNPFNFKGTLPIAIFLDADIASLAADYDIFVRNQTNIIKENNGDSTDPASHKKCGAFLSQFLTVRPFIYHTQTARNWYEKKAKANITQYVKDYS